MDAMPGMCYEIFFSKLKDTQILDEKYVSNIHEYFIAYSAIIERM
jgi:hypothetical protein